LPLSDQPKPRSGILHATLREVSSGLFSADYGGEINPQDADAREMPDSHIGTDRDGVRMWVEEMAKGMGYERVVWDDPV